MKTTSFALLLTLAVLTLTTSCQPKKPEVKKASSVISLLANDQQLKDEIIKIANSLPSNSETVNLINSTGAAYLAGLTGEDLNTDNLLTRTDKAKAYGTILFDLAYTHTYKQVEAFSKLVKIYEKLTKELGFEELVATQSKYRDRYQQNKNNKDSVEIIVSDMLQATNNYIKKNGSAVDISLVFGGAVVKSLNVISYLTMFANGKDQLLEILKKQKGVINSSCDILKKLTADQGVNEFYLTLLPINDIFNSSETFSAESVEKINKLTSFISE
jgi:hypothetical protein